MRIRDWSSDVCSSDLLNGPMTVGEIAATLQVTHVSVSQARRSLETEALVESLSYAQDARRRPIALTSRGRSLVAKLAPVWEAQIGRASGRESVCQYV